MPWLVDIPFTMAGYLGPSLFGLLAAWLLNKGLIDVVLWGSQAFLLLMLLTVRGPLGWLLVPGLLVVLFLVATKAGDPLRTLYAYAWVWFLLIAAVERMLIFLTRKDYQAGQNDAAVLSRLTRLSGELWAVLFLIGTIAALVYGGTMLLRLGQ